MGSTCQTRVVIFTRYSPPLLVFPRPWPALALKFTHIHLTLQWGSIEAVNHLWACSGISGQCQSVYTSSELKEIASRFSALFLDGLLPQAKSQFGKNGNDSSNLIFINVKLNQADQNWHQAAAKFEPFDWLQSA